MYYSNFNIQSEARDELSNRQARNFWRRVLHFGKSLKLCSFTLASKQADTKNRVDEGIQLIPVENIIGSVSDNHHFDDRFNPCQTVSAERWTSIYIGFLLGAAIPPINVYEINGYYYVEDGHHRVSVAHAVGQIMIEAHIISIRRPSTESVMG